MIWAISPVNGAWVHKSIITPLEEGLRRINVVFAGCNIYSVNPTSLSLKDKAIYLITGLALAAFPINTVIWIAWQIFGHPKQFFREHYNPEVERPAEAPPASQPAPVRAAEPPAAAPPRPQPSASHAAAASDREAEGLVENFFFKETGSQGVPIQTNWKVTVSPSQILVLQHCDEHASTAVYDLNWALREFHAKDNSRQFDITWVGDTKTVSTCMTENGVKITKDITLGLPLVQQKRFGLRGFVLDQSKTELRFYSILRNKKYGSPFMQSAPFAIPMIAKKTGTENVDSVVCCKVEVVSEWGWPYSGKGEFWFDSNGILRKFADPLDNSIGEYLSSGP